jgi:YHS domain-containing protein
MISRRSMLLAALGAALPAFADDQAAAPKLGIKGYDPVSYFTDGRAVKGEPSISFDFDEARYRFASAQHRSLFAGDPARYEPQFGGLCATGIAFGKKTESDPTQWKIVDGKLYLFSSVEAKQMADQDPALLMRAAQTAPKR